MNSKEALVAEEMRANAKMQATANKMIPKDLAYKLDQLNAQIVNLISFKLLPKLVEVNKDSSSSLDVINNDL